MHFRPAFVPFVVSLVLVSVSLSALASSTELAPALADCQARLVQADTKFARLYSTDLVYKAYEHYARTDALPEDLKLMARVLCLAIAIEAAQRSYLSTEQRKAYVLTKLDQPTIGDDEQGIFRNLDRDRGYSVEILDRIKPIEFGHFDYRIFDRMFPDDFIPRDIGLRVRAKQIRFAVNVSRHLDLPNWLMVIVCKSFVDHLVPPGRSEDRLIQEIRRNFEQETFP